MNGVLICVASLRHWRLDALIQQMHSYAKRNDSSVHVIAGPDDLRVWAVGQIESSPPEGGTGTWRLTGELPVLRSIEPSERVDIHTDSDEIEIYSNHFKSTGKYLYQVDPGCVIISDRVADASETAGSQVALDPASVAERFVFGVPLWGHSYLDGIRRIPWDCEKIVVSSNGLQLSVSECANANPSDFGSFNPSTVISRISNEIVKPNSVILLSGGLDSAILAGISAVSAEPAVAISFGARKSWDTETAAWIAGQLGIEHSLIEPSVDTAIADLVPSVCANEQPLASPILMAAARSAKRRGTRVVTGDGADQVFGGTFMMREDRRALRSIIECFQRVDPALPDERRSLALKALHRMCAPKYRERLTNIWRFEVQATLANRSLTMTSKHMVASGLTTVVPYLNKEFIHGMSSDAERYLEPFGWKPWLRNSLAMNVLPSAISARVLAQPKRTPGSSMRHVMEAAERHIQTLMPTSWYETHPIVELGRKLRHMVRAYEVAAFDVFAWHFMVERASTTEHVGLNELYQCRHRMDDVDSFYAPIREMNQKILFNPKD